MIITHELTADCDLEIGDLKIPAVFPGALFAEHGLKISGFQSISQRAKQPLK